ARPERQPPGVPLLLDPLVERIVKIRVIAVGKLSTLVQDRPEASHCQSDDARYGQPTDPDESSHPVSPSLSTRVLGDRDRRTIVLGYSTGPVRRCHPGDEGCGSGLVILVRVRMMSGPSGLGLASSDPGPLVGDFEESRMDMIKTLRRFPMAFAPL